MYALVDLTINQVVPQRGQTALMFSGEPGKMRVDIPNDKNSVLHGASPGSIVWSWREETVTAEETITAEDGTEAILLTETTRLVEDQPLFKVFEIVEMLAGAGPIVASTGDPIYDPIALTVAVVRTMREKNKNEANAPTIEKIEATEHLTARRVRELVLRWAKGALPADDADRVALEAREAELAALRAKLQP